MNRSTPQAFSHFSWEYSQHRFIIVDIQVSSSVFGASHSGIPQSSFFDTTLDFFPLIIFGFIFLDFLDFFIVFFSGLFLN